MDGHARLLADTQLCAVQYRVMLRRQRRSWLASCDHNSTCQLPHRHIRPDLPPCHDSRCVGGDAALSNSSLAADRQHSLQAQDNHLRALAEGSTHRLRASGSQVPT